MTPILNLKCNNDNNYNKLVVLDIFNLKLNIIDNNDNIDTGNTITLIQQLSKNQYDLIYDINGCNCKIDAHTTLSPEDVFDTNTYTEKIITRERYLAMNISDKYQVVETAAMISHFPDSIHIMLNIFESICFSDETSNIIRNTTNAREIIPIVTTNEHMDQIIKNQNLEYRYTTYENKTYLLETNFYKMMSTKYNEFLEDEVTKILKNDNRNKICENQQTAFYERHKSNLKKLAKNKYNIDDLNTDNLSTINITFDLSMFDYISSHMAHELASALSSSVRDDYKYASFILNQNQINCLKDILHYDNRLINKRIKEKRIIINNDYIQKG